MDPGGVDENNKEKQLPDGFHPIIGRFQWRIQEVPPDGRKIWHLRDKNNKQENPPFLEKPYIYSTLLAGARCIFAFLGHYSRNQGGQVGMGADQRLLSYGRKNVVVGIRFDSHAKELLDLAIAKVADPGDTLIAIHVCRNSDDISKQKALLDGYLDEYQCLCNKKQVALNAKVSKGSIRKVLVKEAKNHNASVLIVGKAKKSALGEWVSIAKYCAKKLLPTTDIVAIHNGKIVFSRCSTLKLEDDIKFKDNRSEFGESEISEMSRFSFDGRDDSTCSKNGSISPFRGHNKRGSLSSISLPAEDFTKHRPGWPLLQTASSITEPVLKARKMSVVNWVMSLPRRSFSEVSEFTFPTYFENSIERESGISNKMSKRELPKDLELILVKNLADIEVFSKNVLKISTSDFSSGNLIGKGGSSSVYKGVLPGGKLVAVKILKSSKEAWRDFTQEIDIVITLKHNRVTHLLGISVEDNYLITVYDFLCKGNLEEILHGDRKENGVLSWEARFKIAVGIAEALNYLHHEIPKQVIHKDVKSSNILLTDELEPQLCDFGLATWGPTRTSFITDSDVVGTFGYLAPEYFMYGKVSDKIDVYAFGVVLLELLSGKRPIRLEAARDQESLVMWAKPKLESGDLKSILDPDLDGNVDETQMQRMAQAASLCLTQAARLRPNICRILSILNVEEPIDVEKPEHGTYEDSEDKDEYDDEVYPDSSAESHLSLAFLDVNDNSASFSSVDPSSPLSVEEYLKQRWSR